MSKHPLAVMVGITGDMGFAAGCLLRALKRHSPGLDAHILLYTDGALPATDEALLKALGARPRRYEPPACAFSEHAIRQYSYLSLVRFEGFKLLAEYAAVIWLDVDTAIQGDISPLAGYGPLALALEDPFFTESGRTSPAAINANSPIPELDGNAANLNSGVLVLRDSLPDPLGMYGQCMAWMREYAPRFDYIDQGVLNMLAQKLRRESPGLFALIPYEQFNAHPRNPLAWKAPLVHAFGAYKLWDDGLTRAAFPEWQRDYEHWLESGGSPWGGTVANAAFLEAGAFAMLGRFQESMEKAQEGITRLQDALEKERLARGKMETLLQRLGDKK